MALVSKFRDLNGAYLREPGLLRRLNEERFYIGRTWVMDRRLACNFLGDADQQIHSTFSEEEIQSLGIVAETTEMSLRQMKAEAEELLNESRHHGAEAA